jgi:MYXO-CTERM domain-containing protein
MNLLLALIVALLIFSLPTWPYSAGWSYYPSGGFGLVVLVVLVLLLTRRRV